MITLTIEIQHRNPEKCAGCGGAIVAPAEITCVPTEAADPHLPLIIMDSYHARCAPIEEHSA